jgi:hypothetical protein
MARLSRASRRKPGRSSVRSVSVPSVCPRAGRGAVRGWAVRTPPALRIRAAAMALARAASPAAPSAVARTGPRRKAVAEEGGGVGQRFQGEGGGQFSGPFLAQQVGPAGCGEGSELRYGRAGAGGGDDQCGRGSGGQDASDGEAVCEQGEWQDAGLTELVDQAGQLRTDQGLGEGEPGGAVGAGAGVYQPDQAKAGHGDADAAHGGGEEEIGGTGDAQQRTVAGRSGRHEESFVAAGQGGPPQVTGA